jgi:hypothetical protein
MLSEKELEQQINDAVDLVQLTKSLQELLSGPYAISPDEDLYCTKARVDRIDDLRVVIRPNDHPPPHFHVIGQDFDVSFEIESGILLEGRIDPPHYQKVKWWHKRAKQILNRIWENTRTTDK